MKMKPMKFSDRGIPILSLDDKLDALATCLKNGSDEDSAGHLCDLLALVKARLGISHTKLMKLYGQHPAPIREE
jgi:hypothetical protein